MVMRTVLVQVDGSAQARRAVKAAFLAAGRDGGHVVGVCVVPQSKKLTAEAMLFSRATLNTPNPDVHAALARAEHQGGPEIEAARRCFEEVAKAMKAEILERPPNPGGLTACFRLAADGNAGSLAEQGRVFDLVVVRQPRDDPEHLLRESLRAVLFEAGRPILVAPDRELASLGSRPLIAWSRSALSARAAAISRNFFQDAQEVGILSVASKGGSGPTARDLADYIGWHGLNAAVIEAELGKKRLGDVLLEEAERFGADLLVMGAYSHSPFRETLTGGVTNYVLSHAELPLLMTH